MGDSLRAIQVRSHAEEPSVCFHLMRSDGTMEDFSTNKCIASLFPAWSASHAAKVRICTELRRVYQSASGKVTPTAVSHLLMNACMPSDLCFLLCATGDEIL